MDEETKPEWQGGSEAQIPWSNTTRKLPKWPLYPCCWCSGGGTSWWRGPPIRKCSPEGTRQLDLVIPSDLVLYDSMTWVRQAKDRLQAQHRGGSSGSRAGNHLGSARMERSEEHKETEMEGAPLLLYQEKGFIIFCRPNRRQWTQNKLFFQHEISGANGMRGNIYQ